MTRCSIRCSTPGSTRRPLLLAAALCAALGAAASARAQEPAADPTLGDKLKDLKTMVAQPKMEDDFRAVDLIDALSRGTDKLNGKDKDKLARGLGDVFRTGKPRPPDKAHIYRQSAIALGLLGEDGARELQKAVTDARFKGRDYAALRAQLLVELGHTKDPKQIDFLLDQALRSPDDDVMAAAGEALGNFTAMELKQRREVVKELIGRYGDLHAKATQPDPTDPRAPIDFGPQNARATLQKVEGKWNATLAALTGQTFTSQPDWQHWLNKTRDWVPPGGPKK